ncbi:hypothetical protein ZHAS_00008514 [Anopheles sinensis]|uniref:Uncharacterized protein n=1 Tax=Anopheles sinensis TaxID=74873 RepID=A0A084VSN1_ANOSI|nr:hypothetical protein ZHAS_00008514 [Anopheles sinensis]
MALNTSARSATSDQTEASVSGKRRSAERDGAHHEPWVRDGNEGFRSCVPPSANKGKLKGRFVREKWTAEGGKETDWGDFPGEAHATGWGKFEAR